MKSTTSLVKKAYQHVIPQIENHCKHYGFHNANHTISVFERATYLALSENINSIDIEDLQISAIFHDIGFLKQYPKNEYISSQMARKWLEENNHPEERIQKIEGIIMATVLFSQPKNILEEIIQDSDLDNIGTKDAFKNSQALEKEIKEQGGFEIPSCAFWQFTYRLINAFSFNTKTAKMERSVQRKRNIELIEVYLKMFECEIPNNYEHVEKII